MIAELADKLRLRFRYPENHIHAVVYEYRQHSTAVEIMGNLRVVADDPTDYKFVECALVADARFIVSGDRHLLKIARYQGVQLVDASTFLSLLVL